MEMTGHLSELSWSELLRFLDLSQQDGCLTIEYIAASSRFVPCNSHHFWISKGYLVGAAKKLDNRGLLKQIHRQGWLSYQAGERLTSTLPEAMPMGSYLKQQGVLTLKQLRWLFHDQVLSPVQDVAGLSEGTFSFRTLDTLPQMEMTGLKLPIYEIQKCLTLRAA